MACIDGSASKRINGQIMTTLMIERTTREELKAVSFLFFFPIKGLLTSTSNVL